MTEPSDDFEEYLGQAEDEAAIGAVIEALPRTTATTTALGMSTAVGALRDGETKVAIAALKTVVSHLEEGLDD